MIAQDEIVLVTSGEYSGFEVLGVGKATKAFDEDEAKIIFLNEIDSLPRYSTIVNAFEFGDWLFMSGYLEKVKVYDLWLDDPIRW